ncbi:EF-hand calcium-binding domain-containing protein 6 [Anabas testudineus]|uniref:EF-hand calcium-binding domain-containing protein 6 n=1 Tax=Anabas testudineus TaxID=64144 RepID=UPI000E45E1DB|nr:EF-hand calcium-binding domain-containing protein 6 [Anabas testudineus]
MAKLLPLHSELGQLVINQRPQTALSTTRSSTRRRIGGGFGQAWIHTERGRGIILEEVARMIHSRLVNIRSAFKAVNPSGTGLVSKEDFRQVLKSLLSLSQNQLDTVLSEVCDGSAAMVDYVQFLRRFSRVPVVRRVSSSSSSIGGNLRTVIRAFRLFDHNREGQIEQHDFRRILDNYCIQLTNKEFQRLWHHYSPNNVAKISYELFLENLGFGDGHNFKIAPVCTKLAVSSQGTTPRERADQRKQRAESQSSLRDAPSVSSHGNLQTLFHDKMCMNSIPVWQALQAFDTTRSGLVAQDVLRAVLSSFIFPMNLHSFQKLTSCYGVKATGLVKWKHFLGHFISSGEEEVDTKHNHTDRPCEQPVPDGDSLDFQDIYPRLKEIFHILDVKEAGSITRADLRHLLERRDGTQHLFQSSRITELCNVLDPEHTGVIQLGSLGRLNPGITSARTAPPTIPDNAPQLPGIPEETKGTTAGSEELKTPDEGEHTTQGADKMSEASALWTEVESLLLDGEHLSSAMAAPELCDPQHTGHITQKVLSRYGAPVPDAHVDKLCEAFSSSSGSFSTLVSYNSVLKNLGVPLPEGRNTSSSHGRSCHTERQSPSPQSTLQSVRGQPPPSSPQVGTETCNILDIVFRRIRLRLEQRHTSLNDRIQAIIPYSNAMDLSEADVRKILEDSWVILDHENFDMFTKQLGAVDGRIERSVFQAKYEEATARAAGQQASRGGEGGKKDIGPLLTSAEQCLAALKNRIKIIHGNNVAAFRLMDRQCKSVVDCHDFRVLYNSLGFFCSEEEYERLLDLIGLHPGGNLNYAEFSNVVENNGKRGPQTPSVEEQLHKLLATEARYKWADMAKVLCRFDTDGQGRVDKKSLRGLLFTYALPIGSNEFEQLWSRYDPEGQGSVAVCDFLEKLGFHHEGEVRFLHQKLNQTVPQLRARRPVSSDAASLEHMQRIIQEHYKELSDALAHLETRRDGTVTVEELLSLLHTYSCSIQREQLIHHLHRLNVSMDDSCKRLSYMDFLSAFDHKSEKKCQAPPSTPDALRQIESLDSLSPEVALAKMREQVTSSAPNLYKAFSAFDQDKTGKVKALEFRQVLDSFCAHLSDKQYRHLLTKLELDCDNSTVNWKDFLNKFESHSPVISDRAMSRSTEREAMRSPFDTETPGITELPQQIQETGSSQLYKTIKELMDQDPSNTISKEQCRQLLDRHCPSLTNDQFEDVWRQMPVTEQKKLHYRQFRKYFRAVGSADGPNNKILLPSPELRDADSAIKPHRPNTGSAILQRTKSAPQCTSRRSAPVGRPGTGSTPGNMEKRLRRAVQHCWKEIQRKCGEEDPQQGGHISTTCFLGILQSLDISMTQEQFENLAERFDFMHNGCVSYHSFLRHFLLNLKPAETTRAFERLKLPLPNTQTSQGVLSKDCVEVMLRIHDVVRSSWTSIRRSFLTSDRTRTGNIPVQDFRKVLCHFAVNLSEEEFFHLCSYFDAKSTGKICYNNFLWSFLH